MRNEQLGGERALGGVVADRERHALRVRGRGVALRGGPAPGARAEQRKQREQDVGEGIHAAEGAASRAGSGCRSVAAAPVTGR